MYIIFLFFEWKISISGLLLKFITFAEAFALWIVSIDTYKRNNNKEKYSNTYMCINSQNLYQPREFLKANKR